MKRQERSSRKKCSRNALLAAQLTNLSAAVQKSLIVQAKVQLRTDRVPLLCRVQRTGPGRRRLRRLEPEAGHWGRRIGDPCELAPVDLAAKPHVVILLHLADDGAGDSVHHHFVRREELLDKRNVESWPLLYQ